MKPTERPAGRRLGVLAIDQGVSGLSNVLMAVMAARMLDVQSFGLFWIVFLFFVVAVGGTRPLVGDPLLILAEKPESQAGDALGSGILLGFWLSLITILIGLGSHFWDARLGYAFVVLGLCVPLLVLQDLGRYLAIAQQRPAFALLLDLVWLAVMGIGIGLLIAANAQSLWQFVGAWAGAGAVAGLLVLREFRRTRIRFRLTWLRASWNFSWRYLVSHLTSQGSALATAVISTAILGAHAVGAIQAALLTQRPFTVFVVAAMATGVVEISRGPRERRAIYGAAVKITAITTVVAALNGLLPFVMSDRMGRALLGESWHAAQPLFLAAATQTVMMGLLSGARAGLVGQRAASLAMRVDVLKTVLIVVATIVGAIVAGARGAMWAVAIGHGIGALIWWVAFVSNADSRASNIVYGNKPGEPDGDIAHVSDTT